MAEAMIQCLDTQNVADKTIKIAQRYDITPLRPCALMSEHQLHITYTQPGHAQYAILSGTLDWYQHGLLAVYHYCNRLEIPCPLSTLATGSGITSRSC